jgi:type I restriction enzyme R subunit
MQTLARYLEQLETKSGIWFLDVRRPQNLPSALGGGGLKELLAQDIIGLTATPATHTREIFGGPSSNMIAARL